MANFSFAIDGQVDMMSLNPLEMTNFETAGALAGFAGVIVTILLRRITATRQHHHHFEACETEDDTIL